MPPDRALPLTPRHFASAAELLADSFFSNPAHMYICPDARHRIAQLEWLLGGNLRLQPDLRTSLCVVDGNVVNAMGFWTRSTAPDIGVLRKIQAGILRAPFRLGWTGFRRLFEVTREEPTYAIALATQRPENVTFYQRLGFEPVWSDVVGSGPGAFRSWIMVYTPAA